MKKTISWEKAITVGGIAGVMYFLVATVMDYFNNSSMTWIENITASAIFAVLVIFIWKNKLHIKKRIARKKKT